MPEDKIEKKNSDDTFDDVSLYGSILWAARTLGRSYDWMMNNRHKLIEYGFPEVDRLTGRYLKADVIMWVEKRRVILDDFKKVEPPYKEGRYDGL